MMKKETKQRLKRLEETQEEILMKLHGVEEGYDDKEFVEIEVPEVPAFEMAVEQERDEEGKRITSISYEDAIEKVKDKGCRLLRVDEVRAMRNYAIGQLGFKWKEKEAVEELFGIEDMAVGEWIYDCEEVAGIRWGNGADAGVFALTLSYAPSRSYSNIGFRCCKDLE